MAVLYETLQLGMGDLDRIELPKFQRGFVWTNAKKNDFIETLHKGFPFGSFLVYPENITPDSKLLLLDGQQRLSTIKQYKEGPLKFWKPINRNLYDEGFNRINELLNDIDPQIAKQWKEAEFDKLISGDKNLADWADEVAEHDREARQELRSVITQLQTKVHEYVNMDDLTILAIKFTGNKENIADVFSNLNKGGIPLSKYEIYSAAWINDEINLLPQEQSKEQDEILHHVKNYYLKMAQDAEFDLYNFSEDEFSSQRNITLSELCIALGSFVQKRLGSLVAPSQNSINEIGFGLLGITTGVDNRQLGTLNEHTPEIKKNLQIILEKTDVISTSLQEIFSKLLKRISAKKTNEYATGLTTTFKTLSYFAALWNLDPSSAEYRNTLKNISAYYVYDSFSQLWSSHGDQRLLDYYPTVSKRNYLEPINENTIPRSLP